MTALGLESSRENRGSLRCIASVAAALSLVTVAPVSAHAQGTDPVTAEALFQEGKSLLDQNRFGEACPKLAESQRLDPATGTLMALAICHEGNGELASAWSEYTSVESRSKKDGREDRQKAAHERANALRPRLSTLEVSVPPEVTSLDGLVIKRDGQDFGRATWNTAVPIDGGEHTIEVSASSKVPWKASITVKREGDRAVLKVPALSASESAGAPAGNATDASDPAASPAGPAPSSGLSGQQWLGLTVGVAGVAALGVGGFFLATALGEKANAQDASDPDRCDGSKCGKYGLELRSDAVTKGNIATALGIGGGVLLAGGATLFFTGKKAAAASAVAPGLRVGALAGRGGALLRVEGSF